MNFNGMSTLYGEAAQLFGFLPPVYDVPISRRQEDLPVNVSIGRRQEDLPVNVSRHEDMPATRSRQDYSRRDRSHSPSDRRIRSPRRRSPREDMDVNRRVFDDFVSNDYNYERPRSNNNSYRENRSTSRDYRERRRSRSRSRSRDRDRVRLQRRSRDSSREGRNGDDSRDRRRREADAVDDYHVDRIRRHKEKETYGRDDNQRSELSVRSQTIIVQNLGPIASEQQIEDHLRLAGLKAVSVAVIRDKKGLSKGFGFVEFENIDDAEKWMQVTKRNIVINGRSAQLDYSKKKRNIEHTVPDWHCSECKALNFGSRKRSETVTCFKCGAPQKDSNDEKKSKSNEIPKPEPCNVLMLRGMSFNTSEEAIRMTITQLTTHPIYDVRLIKDKVTDMSRGFAFVELGTPEHAASLLETIENSVPPFEIDMRRIQVGYARHGYHAPLNGKKSRGSMVSNQTAANNAVAQAAAVKETSEYSQSMADSYASAGHMAPNQGNVSSYQAYSSTPAAASSYGTYDQATGYYYDASTGLYYDPITGYYYNGTTGQFLYWNGSKYQAINQDGTPAVNQPAVQTTDVQQEEKKVEGEKDKINVSGQKPKNARKIAKDMERWAKKMNHAKEVRKTAVKQAQDELKALEQKEEELRKRIITEKSLTGLLGQVVDAKDGVRSLFVPDDDEEGSVLKLGSALSATAYSKPRSAGLVDIPDDEDDDFVDETKFVDSTKLACLLCKRQFPSKEVLTKHLQISQLHKQNLEKYKQEKKR